MKGFMADIMGVSGCSFESLLAAVSESLESLLLLLLLLFEFEFEFEFEFDSLFEFDEPPLFPPTKFCRKSWSRPHSTWRTGTKQPNTQATQITKPANLMPFRRAPDDRRLAAAVVATLIRLASAIVCLDCDSVVVDVILIDLNMV